MAISNEAKAPTGRPFEWLTREEQEDLTRTTHGFAIALVVAHFAAYFLTLFGALAPLPGPAALTLAANIFFSVMNGFAIGLLFVIGHDCVHKSFAPSKRGNQILARLVFIPCAHSASQWEVVHNKNHHGKTNFRGVDYVWAPMDLEEYRAATPLRRFMERLYRGPAGPFFYYYLDFWSRRLVLPLAGEMRAEWRRHIADSILVVSTLALTIAGVLWAGKALNPERSYLVIFLLGWAIPFTLWNYIAAFSVYIQHTHPNVHWYEDPKEWTFYRAAIEGTIHTEMPTPWLWLYQNAMEHTAHHALPTVPAHKLRKAEAKLLARYGDSVTRVPFRWGDYFATVKACKLYDYKAHHWMDFNGRRTGPVMAAEPAGAQRETAPA